MVGFCQRLASILRRGLHKMHRPYPSTFILFFFLSFVAFLSHFHFYLFSFIVILGVSFGLRKYILQDIAISRRKQRKFYLFSMRPFLFFKYPLSSEYRNLKEWNTNPQLSRKMIEKCLGFFPSYLCGDVDFETMRWLNILLSHAFPFASPALGQKLQNAFVRHKLLSSSEANTYALPKL